MFRNARYTIGSWNESRARIRALKYWSVPWGLLPFSKVASKLRWCKFPSLRVVVLLAAARSAATRYKVFGFHKTCTHVWRLIVSWRATCCYQCRHHGRAEPGGAGATYRCEIAHYYCTKRIRIRTSAYSLRAPRR
eukprot:7327511-Pyramimonas_sp.AAC.4